MKTSRIPLFVALALIAAACGKTDPNAPRSEYFSIFADEQCATQPLKNINISIFEGTDYVYLQTSEKDFKVTWQDAAPTPWAEISECTDLGNGIWRIGITHASRADYVLYSRRGGSLSVVAPQKAAGAFFNAYQGFAERAGNTCESFLYGNPSPHVSDGEMHISKWSTTLRNIGFTSEIIAPDDTERCYGKYGCIKIGDDEGHPGNVLTPPSADIRYDSLLVVSFCAVAYKSTAGVPDDNKFTVSVAGGGFIRDNGKSSMVLEAPYVPFDVNTMWKGSQFLVFISSSKDNPLTAGTRLRITSGAGTSAEGARLYIKNVSVMKMEDGFNEDIYTLNGGSGPDKVLNSVLKK